MDGLVGGSSRYVWLRINGTLRWIAWSSPGRIAGLRLRTDRCAVRRIRKCARKRRERRHHAIVTREVAHPSDCRIRDDVLQADASLAWTVSATMQVRIKEMHP